MKKNKTKLSRKSLRSILKKSLLQERGVLPGGTASTPIPGAPEDMPAGAATPGGNQTTNPAIETDLWDAIGPSSASSTSNIANNITDTGRSSEDKNVIKLAEPIDVEFEFVDLGVTGRVATGVGSTFETVKVKITHKLPADGPGKYYALAKTGAAKALKSAMWDSFQLGMTGFAGSVATHVFQAVQEWEEIQDSYNVFEFFSLGTAPTSYSSDLSEAKIKNAEAVNTAMKEAGCSGQAVFFYSSKSGKIIHGLAEIADEYDIDTLRDDIDDVKDDYEGVETQALCDEMLSFLDDIPEEWSAWSSTKKLVGKGMDWLVGTGESGSVDESVIRSIIMKRLLKEAEGEEFTGESWDNPAKYKTSYADIGTDYVKYVTKDFTDPSRNGGPYKFMPGDQLLLHYNKDGTNQVAIINPTVGTRNVGGEAALKPAIEQIITGMTGGSGQADLYPWDEMAFWITNVNYKDTSNESRPNGITDPYRHPEFSKILADSVNAKYKQFRNMFSGIGGDAAEEPAEEPAEETSAKKCPTPEEITAFKTAIGFNINANKASKVSQLEKALNAYITRWGLDGSIGDPDSSWGEETDTAFRKVVMHAKDNHPNFDASLPWNDIADNWKKYARKLPQKGYTNNLTGILAFVVDAYTCKDDNANTVIDPSSGGGSGGGAAPKKDKGDGGKKEGGCADTKRTYRDVQVDFEGPMKTGKFALEKSALDTLRITMQKLAAAWVANQAHGLNPLTAEQSGEFNVGVGGRIKLKSHDWNVAGVTDRSVFKKYQRIIDTAMKDAVKTAKRDSKGVNKVKGSTINITMPCGTYTRINESRHLSDEQLLVEMIRKLIRE